LNSGQEIQLQTITAVNFEIRIWLPEKLPKEWIEDMTKDSHSDKAIQSTQRLRHFFNLRLLGKSAIKSNLILLFLFLNVAFIPTGFSLADEVHLKNGDRLTGQILKMHDNNLVLKTTYAGEIAINWQEVTGIRTDDPLKFVLEDETELEGITKEIENGKIMIDTDKLETPVVFSTADVMTINPEPVKPVRITARANADLANERGNTNKDDYSFNGTFIARTDKNRYEIGGEFSNEKAYGLTTSQNWIVSGNYRHFLDEKWYAYADTLFEHDEFKDLNLRRTLGAGAGYQIFETSNLNLSISLGLSSVNENFKVAEDNDYVAGNWNVNYDQYFFKKSVQLFHVNTGYISIQNTNDWFLKTRTGLRFPLYKGLSATLQYSYDWDNQLSESAEKNEDTKLHFLLGYEFKN